MKRFKKQMKADGQAVGSGWNVGGTLHKATISEWHQAKWGNGLATCSDWVVAIAGLNGTKTPTGGVFIVTLDISTGDKLLAASIQLLQAVTEGTRKHVASSGDLRMSEIAMSAASALGWLKVEDNAAG